MADAPRLKFRWTRETRPLVGTMSREAWNLLSLQDDRPVRFNVENTPLADIARDSVVLGAIAFKVDDATARVAVFRNDPKDEKPVNQYQYDVCLNLPAHPRFDFMVVAASTCANENMRIFGEETVFFTKRRNNDGFEHHMYELPSDVAAIIRGNRE
ncbi:MAG: hypothetical protein Q7R30_04900 [Acidobacteriota bacterium]|nr:hypothetical protein [Acidobacteriota bacterium]